MTSKRKAKKDTSCFCRHKLPAYAREMMWFTVRHGDRVYVWEWKELFDSFMKSKRASANVFRCLRRICATRKPIDD